MDVLTRSLTWVKHGALADLFIYTKSSAFALAQIYRLFYFIFH